MTRQKKSRKVGAIGTRKQESRPADTKQTRRPKKPKGQPSGNRNSLVEETNTNVPKSQNKKTNPKLGSKKPISLVAVEKPKADKPKPIEHSKEMPKVRIQKGTDDKLEPQVELANIESDARLLDLAERVESGEVLAGKDAKYFNKMMERLDELLDELGITDEDESDDLYAQDDGLESLKSLGGNEWDDLLDESK